jgi:hypothetical protein
MDHIWPKNRTGSHCTEEKRVGPKDYSLAAFLRIMNTRLPLPRMNATLCAALTLLSGAGIAADSAGSSTDVGSLSTSQAVILAPAALEASDVVIGNVAISNGSIFNLDDPEENKALFRLANRLHMTTRTDVIEQQLLFAPGDRFSAQALEESERILRANRYLDSVSIQPVKLDDGKVDVNIATSDVWTLMPRLSLSRSGGRNKAALGIKEQNLLGSGTAIELMYKSDVDRDYHVLKYHDRNLGHSWYGLTVNVEDNSDGHSGFLEIGKPFYSLDSRQAQGLSLLDRDSVGSFYERGDVAAEYRQQQTAYELYRGWSKGLRNGWTRRYVAGLAYDAHRFSAVPDSEYPNAVLPQDRQFLTPFVGIEIVEDRYEKSQNYDQIDRTEDRFLGTRLSARLGVAREGSGSDRDAFLIAADAQKGFGSSDRASLILAGGVRTRLEQGDFRNLALDLSADYYRRQSERRLLYVGFNATYGQDLDRDQYLVLGGDTGLRGYPLRFQTGDKRALFTIEQRYFSDWYPFRLFHVGAAAFLDIGRTWGDGPTGAAASQLLKNVGVGLRIGSSRSGLGRMIHIDLAFPLDDKKDIDNVQFLVSTRKSF